MAPIRLVQKSRCRSSLGTKRKNVSEGGKSRRFDESTAVTVLDGGRIDKRQAELPEKRQFRGMEATGR